MLRVTAPSAVASARRRLAAASRRIHTSHFYINGEWYDPKSPDALDVINPATGDPITKLALGSVDDVDAAVAAARTAFPSWSSTSKVERLELLRRLATLYQERAPEMAVAISEEMGAPIKLARTAQSAVGLRHIKTFIDVLDDFSFEERSLGAKEIILHEPLGVCACITPWNWPMNQ